MVYSITLFLDRFLTTILVFTIFIFVVVVAFVSFNLFHSKMLFKMNTKFFIFYFFIFCYLIYNFNAIKIQKNASICMHAPAREKIFVWRFQRHTYAKFDRNISKASRVMNILPTDHN